MTIDWRFGRRIIPAVLCLLSLTPRLWAEDRAELYPVQLDWTEDDSVIRYEVIIEEEEEEEYREILREFTSAFSLEISLPPGNYRCRVVPYDYLEKPGEGSLWMGFTVLAPKEPEPEPVPVVPEPVPEPEPEPAPVVPEPVPEPMTKPPPPPKIIVPRRFGIYLSAAWMPLLPIYGQDNLFYDYSPILPGAGLRAGLLYTSLEALNIGLEAAGSWYSFSRNNGPLNGITAGINLVAQKRPRESKFGFTLRAGGGLIVLDNMRWINSNIGFSLGFYPVERFFIEAGLDSVHIFTVDLSGCIRPWLGIGFQF